jgi:toxin FitB
VRFLVDANVLSEATRDRADEKVERWLRDNLRQSAVNPIILGEIEIGIRLLPVGRRRHALQEWFDDAVRALHVFEIDAQTAEVWAALVAELQRKGRAMPVKDSLIAATARQHGLTVATRNVADYRYAGVKVVNPFAK